MSDARDRILVVEDDFLVCDTIIGVLEERGFEATRAADGGTAFAMLMSRKRHYAAVVIDLRLPGEMTGRALARAVRKLGPGMVLISADHDELEAARQDDPDAVCLAKPFGSDELFNCIALSAKRLMPEV